MVFFIASCSLLVILFTIMNCLVDYAYNRIESHNELKMEQYSEYMRKARNRARKRRWKTKQAMKEKNE